MKNIPLGKLLAVVLCQLSLLGFLSAKSSGNIDTNLSEGLGKKAKNTATIKLIVDEPIYEDESGYQLLIDRSGQASNIWTGLEGDDLPFDRLEEIFNFCNYTIPSLAEPDPFTEYFVHQGSCDSIEIEPGIYDMAVINPTPEWDEEGYYPIPLDGYMRVAYGGIFSRINVVAGHTYVFHVSLDVLTRGDMVTYTPPTTLVDLEVIRAIVPPVSHHFGDKEKIGISIANHGKVPCQEEFEAGYSIDGKEPVTEKIQTPIPSGESIEYTFLTTADLSSQDSFVIKTWVSYPGDPLPTNDTVQTTIKKIPSLSIPFTETFDEEEWLSRWTRIDINPNTTGWEFYNNVYGNDALDNPDGGVAFFWQSQQGPADNYLISPALQFSKGSHTIQFYFKPRSSTYPESFEFFLGASADPSQMQLVESFSNLTKNDAWDVFIYNLQLPQDSVLYLAFHVSSPEKSGGLFIDQVEVTHGQTDKVPDLAISSIEIPQPDCHLTDQNPVKVCVTNIGTDTIFGFTASYTVNGQNPFTQQFTDTLARNGIKEFIFEQPADFSKEGTEYLVRVEVSLTSDAPTAETDTENNIAEAKTTHLAPVEPPYTSHFENGDWKPSEENAWRLRSDTSYYAFESGSPLVSTCISLEQGQYHLSYDYTAGDFDYGTASMVKDSYTILLGVSGQDFSQWKEVYSTSEYTHYSPSPEYEKKEIVLEVEQDGVYSLGFRLDEDPEGFALRRVEITRKENIDIRLNSAAFLCAEFCPLDLLKQTDTELEIENRGFEDVSAEIRIKDNKGEIVNEPLSLDLISGEKKRLTVPVNLISIKDGDKIELTAEVSASGETQLYDNQLPLSVTATDTILGHDHFNGDFKNANAIGTSKPSALGIVHYVPTMDTLTAISLGFTKKSTDLPFKITLQGWNHEKQQPAQELFVYHGMRGKEDGFRPVKVPDIILNKGYYFTRIDQLNTNTLDLAVDTLKFSKGFYNIYSDGSMEIENRLGNPCIRLIFGHEGKVFPLDLEIKSIPLPLSNEGLYAINEPVEIEIYNKGTQNSNESQLIVWIDKQKIEKAIPSLKPMEHHTIRLEADLSEDGRHVITAEIHQEGDGNEENNKLSREILCLSAADPYRLDFEDCTDFSISNFNPGWKSIDMDQAYSYGILDYDFPLSGTPFGFITFNPSLCMPNAQSIAPAAQGMKYGASFCAIGKANNDWLISPKLRLPSDTASIRLQVKSISDADGLETFNVLVSTDGDRPADFTPIYKKIEAPTTWTDMNFSLDEYAGKEVYLAIQCTSNNAFIFMIDDIRVSKPENVHNEDLKTDSNGSLSIFPNPSQGRIYLRYSQTIDEVSILSLHGKELMKYSVGKTECSLNLSHLASGIYLIQVKGKSGIQTEKMVIR